MTPEQIHQGLEDLTSHQIEKPKNGDSGEFTIQSIWRVLSERGDIIIIIDAIDEPRLRKQLSALKAKDNAKLKSADIPTDDKTLEFIVHARDPIMSAEQIKLQIYLKERPKVKLHKLIIPTEIEE